MLKKLALGLIIAVFMVDQSAIFAGQVSVTEMARSKKPINVYIKDVVNESGQPQVSADGFKETLKNAFINRKSVKFNVVNTAEESDCQVSAAIKKYQYLKNDPINNFSGPSAILLDAATTENYAEITVEFTVLDTKTGDVLWKDSIMAYKERTMTPEDSLPVVYDKAARTFLWKSFGKGK